jgi:diguanylate cyclase (GGDEF)-like protein
MNPNQKNRILVVDDEVSNLMALNSFLSIEYTVLIAKSGEECLNRVLGDKPDLILLDIIMPDMNGFEVLKKLKESPETRMIPVIIITGLDNENDEEKGFILGAVDYIIKPFKNTIVLARVKTHIQIVNQLRAIERMGMVDGLTDIPNRRCFDDRMGFEWRRAVREKKPLSFMMMDVDKFKLYNDTYGHPQGDTLLKSIAKVFQGAAKRPADLAARLGGEEFGVLLPDTCLDSASEMAEKIRAAVESLRVPTVDGKITTVTVSIGLTSVIPVKDMDYHAFLSHADKLLYSAKESGRNRVCAAGFDPAAVSP